MSVIYNSVIEAYEDAIIAWDFEEADEIKEEFWLLEWWEVEEDKELSLSNSII